MIDTDNAPQPALREPETAFAPTAWVDLSAIRHNRALVRNTCPQSRVMAVVKADAYGHGLVAVASALANADGLAVARLSEAAALPALSASAANSAAIWRSPATHMDWVRPGISLYGGLVSVDRPDDIRPAMRLSANVIAMKDIQPGDSVGYHGCWTATRPTRLALVGVGYGDGYPRHARRAHVSIRDRMLPVVGRISMDSLSVDATSLSDCSVGDEVELWGSQVRATDVATNAGTIDYQLLTGLANRVHRSWIE